MDISVVNSKSKLVALICPFINDKLFIGDLSSLKDNVFVLEVVFFFICIFTLFNSITLLSITLLSISLSYIDLIPFIKFVLSLKSYLISKSKLDKLILSHDSRFIMLILFVSTSNFI